MQIAIAASGENLNSPVDLRFGRCPYFLIVDSENDEYETIVNKAEKALRGAGISAAQLISDKGVKAVIAGNFGPNAVNVLSNSGIKIFTLPTEKQGESVRMTAKEALELYKAGKLKELTTTNVSHCNQERCRK